MHRLIFTLLLWPWLLMGQEFTLGHVGFVGQWQATGPTLLVSEDFEGTGNPGWTTVGGGTANFDDTTNVLAGSQSMALVGITVYTNFSGGGECWAHLRYKQIAMAAGGNSYTIVIADSGGDALASCRAYENTGVWFFRVYCGTAYATVTDTSLPLDTDLYCWLHYKKGTGADGIADFEVSETSTRSGSGNRYKQVTTGTATADAARFQLKSGDANYPNVFDNVKIDNAGYPTP